MFEMKQSKMVALQEQNIAEKLVVSLDYVSARDKLLKAQELFPKLDNIDLMLIVCDILCAASMKFPGIGVDCYWVLQLLPSASASDVKARYHKLMNMLQPIKNKFPGTELALRFIREAYFVLSDRGNRSAFDLYRQASWTGIGTASNQGTSNKESFPAARISSGSNMVSTSDISRSMLLKSMKGMESNTLTSGKTNQQQGEVDLQKGTVPAHMNFITSRVIDRHNESLSSPLTTHSVSSLRNLSRPSKDVERKGPNFVFYDFENNRKTDVFEVGQIWAAQYQADVPHCYAQININLKSEISVTWLKPIPVTADERRWCEAALPVACGSFYLDPDMSEKRITGLFQLSHMCSWTHGITEEQFEIYPKKGEVWAIYKDWDLAEWSLNPKTAEGCKFEMVELLTDYSKYVGAFVVCLDKIEGFRSAYQRCTNRDDQFFCITPDNLYIFSHKIPTFRFMGGEMQGVVAGMLELDPLALPDDIAQDDANRDLLIKEGPRNLSSFTHNPQCFPSMTTYPENQCLNSTWSQNDFLSGQIWAVYSGTDLMPRCYTRINSVVSVSQVCVTILEPEPILDNEIHWHKENLPIVAGIFKVSRTTMNIEMSQFSHLVSCQQSINKTLYMIYPMKGEFWAMYKNYNSKWKQSDYNDYECQIVEILSDFCEGSFILIAKLLEVKGCLTFFQRQHVDGFELTRTVSKTDMLAFSHRIPAFIVPGVGRYGIPEGSWHLGADALPPKRGT
ncbi:uncharacterized protein LOC122644664 [Telopea speciosissima]|uniref:uncharacterized protein LOC122644664 n=1 Tax=Telopea speciosissima TaxID=54955 RepID=UPI001CC56CE6|nr:uncharacterized protein LOC122644664 [Telopea speciosissima]